MAKPISVRSFRENLANNLYSEKEISSMYNNLIRFPNSNNNKEKLEILIEYMSKNPTSNNLAATPVDEVEIKIITDDDIVNKYCQLRSSALTRGIEFSLSLKDIKSLLSKKKCHYTGISFEGTRELRRTIDRIDNTKGYISGNVVACTYAANQFKEQVFESKVTTNFKGNLKVIKKIITVLEGV